jgi:hypothetical protein
VASQSADPTGDIGVFERLTSLFRPSTDAYIARVTTALVRDGLQPSDLDNFQASPGFDGSGRVFAILREHGLSPADGAEALRLAVSLFRKMRHMAEARGWPLRAHPPAGDVTRMEAYFLELLEEAAQAIAFRS